MADNEELVDYEDEEAQEPEVAKAEVKKGYVGIHSAGFKDLLLKPELIRAIQDCGFEHPSEGARICVMEAFMLHGCMHVYVCEFWHVFKRRLMAV